MVRPKIKNYNMIPEAPSVICKPTITAPNVVIRNNNKPTTPKIVCNPTIQAPNVVVRNKNEGVNVLVRNKLEMKPKYLEKKVVKTEDTQT